MESQAESLTDLTALIVKVRETLVLGDKDEVERSATALSEALYPLLYKWARVSPVLESVRVVESKGVRFNNEEVITGQEASGNLFDPCSLCGPVQDAIGHVWELITTGKDCYNPEKGPFENWLFVVVRNFWSKWIKEEMEIEKQADVEEFEENVKLPDKLDSGGGHSISQNPEIRLVDQDEQNEARDRVEGLLNATNGKPEQQLLTAGLKLSRNGQGGIPKRREIAAQAGIPVEIYDVYKKRLKRLYRNMGY